MTREELVKMYEKAHEVRKEEKRFAAALKGIDIDEGETSAFDDVISRAEAKARGLDEEEYGLEKMHIGVIDEEEEEDELV